MRRIAHAAQLQQLRCVERTPAQHHLTGVDGVRGAAPCQVVNAVLDARGSGAVEQHLVHQRTCRDGEVRPVHDRPQVRLRCAEATTATDVAIEAREAFLAITVHIVGSRQAGLLGGLEEGFDQRVVRQAALHLERAVPSAPLIGTGEAGLHLLEVGQAMGVVPGVHALVGGPPLVVHRVAPLEDHPVDAARAPEHLAAGVVHLPTVHERLGLGLVLPVVEPAADREHERGRHVDEDVPLVVGSSRLEHEHPVAGIGTQPVGERRPSGTSADDDVVVARVWTLLSFGGHRTTSIGSGGAERPSAGDQSARDPLARDQATRMRLAMSTTSAPRAAGSRSSLKR